MPDTIISTPVDPDSNGFNPQHRFGYAEIQNGRKTQEDALAWHVLQDSDFIPTDGGTPLTALEIGHRLWTTYQLLDQPRLKSGTTAVTTVYDGNEHLITAILADAAAFAAVYDNEGRVLGVTRLNRVTHKPSELAEKTRIAAVGGIVLFSMGMLRVNGSLAVSRAIGDNNEGLKQAGVCSESAIDIISIPQIADALHIHQSTIGKIQVISTCDGFTDPAEEQTKKGHELYLLHCLQSIIPGTLNEGQLATYLVNAAKRDGSLDNISVSVQTLVKETPLLTAVLDGHAGSEASTEVAENIGRVFKEQCALSRAAYAEQDLSVDCKKTSYERDNSHPFTTVELTIPGTPKQVKPSEQQDFASITLEEISRTPTPTPTPTPPLVDSPLSRSPEPHPVSIDNNSNSPETRAMLIVLMEAVKEYRSSLLTDELNIIDKKLCASPQIRHACLEISNQLYDLLYSKDIASNHQAIQACYTLLTDMNPTYTTLKNIDIIQKDSSRQAKNILKFFAVVVATMITGILPGLLLMGWVYTKTGQHPLDLLQSNGQRFENELTLLNRKYPFAPQFFKEPPLGQTASENSKQPGHQ